MAQRQVQHQVIPTTAECQLFEVYDEFTNCECTQRVVYNTKDIRSICVGGYLLIAKSLTDNNTDHPVKGSSKTVPTWKLMDMADLLLSLGF